MRPDGGNVYLLVDDDHGCPDNDRHRRHLPRSRVNSTNRREIRLQVDYGQGWPLSDIMWMPEDQPVWDKLLTPELIADLMAWAAFFNREADWETGLFGSEENRRWFDLEGFRLRDELDAQVGHLFDVRLRLWF